MLLSPVINTILLLAFTYFIASLIISAVNETISGVFRLRPKHLKEGLQNMFFDDGWKTYINGAFMKSPFIESLLRKKQSFPTYIPAKNFAHAVLAHCELDVDHLDAPSVIKAIDAAQCLPPKMKEVVKGYVLGGSVQIEELQKNLEDFYDKAMERVSGWYTRLVRRILFCIGFIMAISLNIDTFKIVMDGLSDKDRLEHAADGIAQQVGAINKTGTMTVVMNGDSVRLSTKTEANLGMDSNTSIAAAGQRIRQEEQRVNNVVLTYKNATSYAMGYENWNAFKNEWVTYMPGEHHWFNINWAKFWKKLMGIVITAFALQLGSNYWFGVLNKVVSIRAAGNKPKTSAEENQDS